MSAGVALSVENLRTRFFTRRGAFDAVHDLSFSLRRGETLALVGESGCGKSVTALSLMRLVPSPPGRIVGGAVRLGDTDLLSVGTRAMRALRGDRIAMIFQEPMTSLNPVLTVGSQVAEAVRLHGGLGRAAAREKAVEMLRAVRLPDPARRARDYPHQLSGGMRQRAMIAMALSCSPEVLIADEPTTALDVTIQAQILDLMAGLQAELGTAILLITHDLGVVAEAAQRVVVMYAGRKMEEAPTEALLAAPLHPYTRGLIAAVPTLAPGGRPAELPREIPGTVPPLARLPPGCVFAARCKRADDRCRAVAPPCEEKRPGHFAACWHPGEFPGEPAGDRGAEPRDGRAAGPAAPR